jgi:hypothetical protein
MRYLLGSLIDIVGRWLGMIPSEYDCDGCDVCSYPDGLRNVSPLYVKTLTGKEDTEQQCY